MPRRVGEPKCSHSTRNGSTLVASHADLMTAHARMASVRVCEREACVEDAKDWLRVQGFDVFVNKEPA